jgi:hypothetical protein
MIHNPPTKLSSNYITALSFPQSILSVTARILLYSRPRLGCRRSSSARARSSSARPAKFDYSGTQACKALREEGYEVVLVNSNPATIMTDPEMADRTYIEPLTVETLEDHRAGAARRAAAHRGRPDGLNLAVGWRAGHSGKVRLRAHRRGWTPSSKAEDRGLFKTP